MSRALRPARAGLARPEAEEGVNVMGLIYRQILTRVCAHVWRDAAVAASRRFRSSGGHPLNCVSFSRFHPAGERRRMFTRRRRAAFR